MQRSAIVTGASRGIGAAIAKALCEAGYATVFCYNQNKEKAEALVNEMLSRGFTAAAVKCSVENEQEVAAAMDEAEKLGQLTAAVNCAGIAYIAQIQDSTLSDIKRVLEVNTVGSILVCREAAKRMIKSKKGSILNISSMWGAVGGSCESVYSASKAAVIGHTKALAKELGPSGISVNCIAPGVIDTDMNKQLSAEDKAALAAETPLGRIGSVEDVATAALFLLGSRFITGQTLVVDGGLTL